MIQALNNFLEKNLSTIFFNNHIPVKQFNWSLPVCIFWRVLESWKMMFRTFLFPVGSMFNLGAAVPIVYSQSPLWYFYSFFLWYSLSMSKKKTCGLVFNTVSIPFLQRFRTGRKTSQFTKLKLTITHRIIPVTSYIEVINIIQTDVWDHARSILEVNPARPAALRRGIFHGQTGQPTIFQTRPTRS